MARATRRSDPALAAPSSRLRAPHPGDGPLAGDEVAVWWLATDAARPPDIRRWFATLDDDERARADRFHFEDDRRDFIAAHALLRALLTRRLDVPSTAWRFTSEPGGKPRVDPGLGAPDVAFNLSHTRGLAAAALAWRGAVGVDVEAVDAAKADLAIAQNYFAPAEVAMLRRTPPAGRPLCFFRLWTLKEAYVKAIGAGLAAPLDSFAFTLEPIRIEFAAGGEREALDWQFASPPTTDGHVLAVAVGRAAGDLARLTPRALTPRDL